MRFFGVKLILNLMLWGLFPSLAQSQEPWPLMRDNILQSFAKKVTVNPLLDEVLVSNQPEIFQKILKLSNPSLAPEPEPVAVLAHFQSEGHFEVYYYSVHVIIQFNKREFIIRPFLLLSPYETPPPRHANIEKALETLTLGWSDRKRSLAWASYFVPELKKWLKTSHATGRSCRKTVSSNF